MSGRLLCVDLAHLPHHWRIRDAVACWVLLLATGFPFAAWHPWPEVQWPAAVPYPLFCALVTLLVWGACMSPLSRHVPRWLTVAVAVALILRFLAYDLRQRAGNARGADNVEALEIGARALLDGHDPYWYSTHLGNPIGPLLGGLIMAVPLYWLMSSLFLQLTLAWAGGAALAERVAPRAGLAVVILVAASPWSRATLPYLNDNGLTALLVVAAGAWGYQLAGRDAGWVARVAWTFLFACTLDYRWTMWLIALPYAILFLRRFGVRKALAWLVPILLATLALFVAPMFFPSGGYYDRTIPTLLGHSGSPMGTTGSVIALAAALAALCACCVFVRSLRDVWGATSVSLMVLLVSMSLLWLPDHSAHEAFYRYGFFWYLGWPLAFGIAYLVTPREHRRVTQRAPGGAVAHR